MAHELDGIREKIKRAYECVVNLDGEITAFFDQSDYPVVPKPDDKTFNVVCDYHLERPIPLRFSVLAGEVVHHLRSCFDHLIWQLSDIQYRTKHSNLIEFPVFDAMPSNKDELSRYEGKVRGVLNSEAKAVIKGLQPCNGPNPGGDPLSIIHNMDRFDKHRELVIIFPGIINWHGPRAMKAIMEYYKTKSKGSQAELAEAMKVDSKISLQVAFREFGNRKGQCIF
jgi:hypothetical protein